MVENIDATKSVRDDDIIIAFMGPTGSGKSFFIDLLTNQPGQRAQNTTKSVTQDIEATRVPYPDDPKRCIVLVDTPGFDDATRTDMQILTLISDWLKKTYKRHLKLSGLIYLHRITDNRMYGKSYMNLRTFAELCGEPAASRVILVTTMWERLMGQQAVGEARERELKDVYWRPLIEKGSRVDALRVATNREAWSIVKAVANERLKMERNLAKGKTADDSIVLLQEERVDNKTALFETHAGQSLYNDYQRRLLGQKEKMKTVLAQVEKSNDKQLKKDLRKEYDKLKREFDRTFSDAETLRGSTFSRLLSLLTGGSKGAKETKAKAIGMPAELQDPRGKK